MASSGARSERGFTLVEIMVVALIIAILLAVATVSFLGARRVAQDRAAQTLAREALASAKTLFQIEEDYTLATVDALRAAEPGLKFLLEDQASSGPDEASILPDETTFLAAVLSQTGTCFYIRDEAVPGGGTSFGSKTPTGADPCRANAGGAVTFQERW